MFNSNCNTASVPLVANLDGNGNNGMWGDNGAWWIVIFVLFIADVYVVLLMPPSRCAPALFMPRAGDCGIMICFHYSNDPIFR